MPPTRRLDKDDGILKADWYIWEIIHWFTMTVLKHRIVRGYDLETGRLKYIFWDKSINWEIENGDWQRKIGAKYPKPLLTFN